jgi:hypothetical protein
MKNMVKLFELKLKKSKPSSLTNKEHKIMIRLYGSIKRAIFNTYGYVDLESVFTVLLSISQRIKYSDLGFTSLFAISRIIADHNLNITTEEEARAADKLLKRYRTFVRRVCRLKNSQEKRITDVYSDFFEKLCSEQSQKIRGKDGLQYSYPSGCSIYTTNYDAVLETYWQGIADINDLWKDTNGTLTLWVDKHEGDALNLIKLHGSLGWFGLSDRTIVKLPNFRKTYGKRAVQGEFMLYPIQQKDLYLYPWFNLFYRFKDDLERIKTWIVIGYSFNDEFILNMFVEALRIGDHKLILVTPDAVDIAERKFSLFSTDKVRQVSRKFGEKQTTIEIVKELE